MTKRRPPPASVWTAGGIAAAIYVFLQLSGCTAKGDPSPPPPDPDTREVPCDPKRVLVTVCQQCHTTPARNMAPFPLLTYADTQVVISNKPIWGYMRIALMQGIMPLPPVQIGSADKAILLGWLNAGAPPRLASDVCSVVDAGVLDGVPDAFGDVALDGAAADDALNAEDQGTDSQSPNRDAAPSGDAPVNDASDAGANPDAAGDLDNDE